MGESLELDLNIQEALDTLNQRKTLSRSASFRNSLAKRILPQSKHEQTRSVTENTELEEFIQVEQLVQKEKEVRKVTVNLRHSQPPKLAHIDLDTEKVTRHSRNGGKRLVGKHREFIAKTRSSGFSSRFVLGLIFHAWRGLRL